MRFDGEPTRGGRLWGYGRLPERRRSNGSILIAVVAALTVALVVASAAIPDLVRDLQREREEEMLFRGQQIVDGLERFYRATNRYPMSLEELAEGIMMRGGRRLRFVRPSALTDPLTNEPWAVLRPGDPAVRRFVQAYLKSVGQPPNPVLLQFLTRGGQITLPGRPSPRTMNPRSPQSGPRTVSPQPPPQSEAETDFDLLAQSVESDAEGEATGPVIGVVSKSEKKTVRVFYDLESYRDWAFVFIPDPLLPAAVGEARVKALLSPVMYPSDPLRRLAEAMPTRGRIRAVPGQSGPQREQRPLPGQRNTPFPDPRR
ncbi:MAG TPA: hypothetical protein VNM72_03055 [Blastocatellia bacterium]|nr:hypothetical protein [Blastocatellia bacterium]